MATRRDYRTQQIASSMKRDPFFNDASDELDEADIELLGEAVFIDDGSDDGGFEEEATAVFRPELHGAYAAQAHGGGAHSFADEGVLDEVVSYPDAFDERTEIWDTSDPEPLSFAAPPRRSAPSGPPKSVPRRTGDHGAQRAHGVAHGVADVRPHQPRGSTQRGPSVVAEDAVFGAPPPRSRPAPTIQIPAHVRQTEPERRGFPVTQILLGAVLIVCLFAVALFAYKTLVDTDPAPLAATGSVAVVTSPAGATISLDGTVQARVSPTILTDIEVGRTYALTIELAGHESTTHVLRLEGSDQDLQEFTLRPVSGTVIVSSAPAGATISINGEERGVAPQTIDGLDMSRTYTISAALDEHEPTSRVLRWEADSPRDQEVVLSLAPVAVAAAEPEADPEETAEVEPEVAPEEAEEPATVAVAQRQPAAETTRAAPRETTRDRASAQEPVSARDRPSSAQQPVSARDRPSQTAAAPTRERPSERDRPSERERPSERGTSAAPPAATGGNGSLSVQAVPYGQVWINGRMVAAETPLMNHSVAPGVYQVKVYFVPIRQFSEERAIRIESGENRSVTFRAPR